MFKKVVKIHTQPDAVTNAYIFNNLRILKGKNPGDCYYEEYLRHFEREREKFFDQYHFAVHYAINNAPKRILEIGTRTGLSICNLLSAYIDPKIAKRVVLIDVWNDGFASPGIVKMYFKALNLPLENVQFITGDSKVEVPKLKESFDYILVDGDHNKDTAWIDLENVVPLIAKAGVIVFDDITDRGCNLQDVWDKFKDKYNGQFDFGENHDGKGVGWAIKK